MSTFYVKNEQIVENNITIINDDVKHLKNVLRYKVNDELDVCDENGIRYKTQIENFENDIVVLNILEIINESTECNINVTLFQCLPKADKMELIIQKCTELGIKSVVPVISERVVVKLDDKNESKKIERWQKIAKEASKQSGRQIVPIVENTINLKNMIENLSKYDIFIMPYECEKECMLKNVLRKLDKSIKNVALIIGPEGGFSENDVEILSKCNKLQKVSLGPIILRTETAGIATLAMIIYELDD